MLLLSVEGLMKALVSMRDCVGATCEKEEVGAESSKRKKGAGGVRS